MSRRIGEEHRGSRERATDDLLDLAVDQEAGQQGQRSPESVAEAEGRDWRGRG